MTERLSAGLHTAVGPPSLGRPVGGLGWCALTRSCADCWSGRLREVSDSRESNEDPRQRGVCLCELCSRPMGARTGPFTDLGVCWKAGSAGLPSPVSGRQPGNQKTQRLRPHWEVRAVLCQCQWSGWGPCPPGRAPGGSALPAGEPAHRPEAALLGSGHELHSRYRHRAGGWLQTDTERESGTAWANPPQIFGFK